MKIRRIGLFGGPCSGKSTLAARLFAELKMMGMDVENCTEHVKRWAFIGRSPTGFDQIYLFGHQIQKEDIVLRSTNAIVISESPLHLGICYARKYGLRGHEHLVGLANEFESVYPSLNFLVKRDSDMEYKAHGRFQTWEQALEMDAFIEKSLDEFGLTHHAIKYNDFNALLKITLEALKNG